MGVKATKIDDLDVYNSKIRQISRSYVTRLVNPWYHIDWLYRWLGPQKIECKAIREAHEFTGNIIEKRRKLFRAKQHENNLISIDANTEENDFNKKQKFAMLDTLLMAEHNYKSIDEAGIQEEVDTFIFEGFDTTKTAISFILLMIASHEDVQRRLFEEITSIDQHMDYKELKYLNAVIKESLRLYPPVPFIARVLGEDTILDGIKIPAKTDVIIRIYALHRSPKYFDDPDKFCPERFLENCITHPFAYIPFSAGKRNCIGQQLAKMELQSVVAEIVRNFEMKPVTKLEDVILIPDLLLRTKYPIRLHFTSRFH